MTEKKPKNTHKERLYKGISPTRRSLALLRDEGYTCAVVERWNPFAAIRQDLFGFVDIIAIKPDTTLAVQTTTNNGGNYAAHKKKILENEHFPMVLDAGWKVELHGWHKKTGKKQWECRRENIEL